MTLFAPDLYRNFAIGFAAGALMVAAAYSDEWASKLESPAVAAQPLETPAADAVFAIEPLENEG